MRLVLKGHADITSADRFFEELGDAIGRFHAARDIHEESKPAVVRKNLKKAYRAATNLNCALNELDGNSRQLLDKIVAGGFQMLQRDHLAKIMQGVAAAQAAAATYKASAYRKAGGLSHPYREGLALDVAFALEKHLKVKSTLTKNGPFVVILDIVMAEATGKQRATTHELARRALSSWERKVHSDGKVECPSSYKMEQMAA
jgi:hypothetical protein